MKMIVKMMGILLFLLFANIGCACTGFTASDGKKVLVGMNEDWHRYRRYVDIYPPKDGKFGRILFGWEDYSRQQGINDQGLFWDGYSAPYLSVTVNESKEPIPDPDHLFWVTFLENCSTIYDVIDILDGHDISDLDIEICQVLFVDRFGNSVIFEGNDYVFKEGDYQVVANFYHTHPELGGVGYDRYNTAVSMLENMTDLSMEYFRDICKATHQSITIYSLVCNLTTNVIHYYYGGNFDDVWEINLTEEFKFGLQTYDVLDVFNNNKPNKPRRPIGPHTGSANTTYEYSCNSLDVDGDQLYYKWDWGDGTVSNWIGPYRTGEPCVQTHTWSKKGEYQVKVRVRDENCGKSSWSNPLLVTMPKCKDFRIVWINSLLNKFNFSFPFFKTS